MYFIAMFECSSLIILMHLGGYLLIIADRCHFCFACHFQTVHPIPVIFISISTEITSPFQWHSWHVVLDVFRWLLAEYRRPVPYLFCSPFPNRASDSGDLYIDFNRNHLTFPVALLDFQVEASFNHSLSNLAYASHIASRIAYHVCIMLFEHCTWLIVFLLLVYLVWVELGEEFTNEEPVEFAFEDPVNSDNCAGKMIIPSKSLLSLLC